MLTITNGSTKLTVSRGAYHNIYRFRGFYVVDGPDFDEDPGMGSYSSEDENDDLGTSSQQEIGEEDDGEESDEDGEENDEDDLSQIPLSDMNKKQLQDYAEELGLDWDEDMSKKELKELIKDSKEG